MKTRVLTALALIPPVLAAIFCVSPWPLFGLGLLLLFLGSQELDRLIGRTWSLAGAALWLAGAGAAAVYSSNAAFVLAALGLAALLSGIIGIFYSLRVQKGILQTLISAGWLAGPVISIMTLHMATMGQPPPWFVWRAPLLMAVIPLWAGDTAAIFAGKAFGKRMLAPTISPKKTVEGAIGNFLACLIAAYLLGIVLSIGPSVSIICGLAAGIFGQAGDLFQSWMKRQSGVKDSGSILPGHGGILDRIDSILFTAPIVAAILIFSR
jgi:phosphatidate cytidylyltransferase